MRSIDRNGLTACHHGIRPHIHCTPILTARSLNSEIGAEIYFKCENFQRAGSFKIRGASHAILCLTPEQVSNGVVTHSSGNFAQALALAARSAGVKACIVMPANASQVKLAATAAYGAEIIVCESTIEDRQLQANRIVEERGATFIHPSNDLDVILGQSTAAVELFEVHPDLDVLLVPVGGGGLIAGCSLAAVYFSDHCQTIGAEPLAVDDAWRSLASGNIETNKSTETIADGLRTGLGDRNFPIIQKNVERIIRVSEQAIIDAMQLIWQRMKIVIEPSSAVAYAALEIEKQKFRGKKIGVILSGGNVDLANLPY